MRAILMQQPGAPEVLQPGEAPMPEASGPNDVLLRVDAAGINPIDTKLRARGTYFPDRMPAVLGCDGAGEVLEVGRAVTAFHPGDRVYWFSGGIGGDPGNYAEYTVVPQQRLARLPEAIPTTAGAAAPLVCITAWEALHDRARISAGQTVLVHAGAGGVGHVAIQLARQAGCRVLTTVGSDNFERAEASGAEAIDYQREDFVEAVLERTDGRGADVVFDTVGGGTFSASFAAVRPYGDLVTLLQPADLDWKTARLRNLRVSFELMLSPQFCGWPEAILHQTDILERCAELMAREQLKIDVYDTLPLEQAARAHQWLEAGLPHGKLVLTP